MLPSRQPRWNNASAIHRPLLARPSSPSHPTCCGLQHTLVGPVRSRQACGRCFWTRTSYNGLKRRPRLVRSCLELGPSREGDHTGLITSGLDHRRMTTGSPKGARSLFSSATCSYFRHRCQASATRDVLPSLLPLLLCASYASSRRITHIAAHSHALGL